jgi:hypothetical protein
VADGERTSSRLLPGARPKLWTISAAADSASNHSSRCSAVMATSSGQQPLSAATNPGSASSLRTRGLAAVEAWAATFSIVAIWAAMAEVWRGGVGPSGGGIFGGWIEWLPGGSGCAAANGLDAMAANSASTRAPGIGAMRAVVSFRRQPRAPAPVLVIYSTLYIL